jgi:hypothetical protein
MGIFRSWYDSCYIISQKGEIMSNVLIDLMREKQEWIEAKKHKPSILSASFNLSVIILIGFVVFKIIENPSVFWNVVNLLK